MFIVPLSTLVKSALAVPGEYPPSPGFVVDDDYTVLIYSGSSIVMFRHEGLHRFDDKSAPVPVGEGGVNGGLAAPDGRS